MPLILLSECSCGKRHAIYLPLKLLMEEATTQKIEFPNLMYRMRAAAKRLDNHEQARDELRLAKILLKGEGWQFTNAGMSDVVQCKCGKVVDILKVMHEARGK